MALNNTLEAMKIYRDERITRHLAAVPEEHREAERQKLAAMSELELIFSLGLSIGVVNQDSVQQALQSGQFAEDIGVGVIVLPPEAVQHVEVEEVAQGDTAGVGGANGPANGAPGPPLVTSFVIKVGTFQWEHFYPSPVTSAALAQYRSLAICSIKISMSKCSLQYV